MLTRRDKVLTRGKILIFAILLVFVLAVATGAGISGFQLSQYTEEIGGQTTD